MFGSIEGMQPTYPPMPGQTYATAPPAAALTAYANWFIRVASYIVDYIIPSVFFAVGEDLIGANHAGGGRKFIGAILYLVGVGALIYNRWIRMGRTGKSWGKSLTGTRLIGLHTGQPIGAFKAFLRDLLHILDNVILIIPIGFLWPIWDRKRQTLFGDKIMKTVVIRS